jgi:hypothetical protein
MLSRRDFLEFSLFDPRKCIATILAGEQCFAEHVINGRVAMGALQEFRVVGHALSSYR